MTPPTPPSSGLLIDRARENNLKEVSVEIPHDRFVTVTGLSGSGKSSLAFDTVYAEGQRRYIETFSPYTRQFFDKVKRPDVDSMSNVRPAIAIQQRTRILSSRSTVGSMTDINDYLKIIWSNLATPVCSECDRELLKWNSQTLSEELESFCGAKGDCQFLVGAQVVSSKKKEDFNNQVDRIRTLGYSRYLDPSTHEILLLDDEPPKFRSGKENVLIAILDRFSGDSFSKKRCNETLEQAFSLGMGSVLVFEKSAAGEWSSVKYTTAFSCAEHAVEIARPRPSLFSFNHPLGACSECNGFGKVLTIDRGRIVPDTTKSIEDEAIDCWKGSSSRFEFKRLLAFCSEQGIPVDRPWRELSGAQVDLVFSHKSKKYLGLTHWFDHLEGKKYKMHVRVFLSRYRMQSECPSCGGSRVKRDALAYRIKGKTIAEIWNMPVGHLKDWFGEFHEELVTKKALPRQLKDVFDNVRSRIKHLDDLGLSYLTLDRQARTLSGGETQRVNLAAALGSNLVSTHFVLDEPSVGLHSRDTERLISSLRTLYTRGNSLLVVEHDTDCLEASDVTIEIGPQAGELGGEIVYNGPTDRWGGVTMRSFEPSAASLASDRSLVVRKATVRNLRGLDATIPLDAFVCVTGVSGSGKSTLVRDAVYAEYQRFKGIAVSDELPPVDIEGFDLVDDVVLVDQSPLAKSPRANIATYTKIWDRVRDLLAATDEAKVRHLTRSSFSFNVNAGRCPACDGAGFIREDMQFLSDVFIKCETCLGKRFQAPVLEVRYRGKNVDELLNMTIDRAMDFYEGEHSINTSLTFLQKLGLGHLTLGHSLSELSGGEAQRLKLVPWVQGSEKKRALLIFDEPTTGLHVRDVERLLDLIHYLREHGHSIICIEHNLRLVAEADWILDLGPEGGEHGGQLVLEGTPADFVKAGKKPSSVSYTAKYLAEFCAKYAASARNKKTRAKSPVVPLAAHPAPKTLTIRGAREHNLKNVTVHVPLNSIVAFTGVSGSGKSSIAKDIIYAEGQRRYLDCLSPYARQFIKELKKPDIDDIKNVSPTVCVYQHTFQPTALSTVATMSEVYNFLRLLYAKIGTQYCPDHPEHRISPLSVEQIAEKIKADFAGQVRILAPVIKQKKGNHRAIFQRALETDISEVRVDGSFGSPSNFVDGLEKSKSHSIDFTVVRCNSKTIPRDLLEEGVAQTLSLGGGTLIIKSAEQEAILSSDRTCPVCGTGFFKPDPEDLSFNSRRGICEECEGFGVIDDKTCPECGGARINRAGRHIRIQEKGIYDLCRLTAKELRSFLTTLALDTRQLSIAEPIVRELRGKLDTIIDLGLDYIPLGRDCSTLSGGELQRLRLATAIGSPLSGVIYIFDEPSAGLHPNDNRRLLSKLEQLRARGNSIIQIEHESDSILASDYVIDIGPGAGKNGGKVVYNGPLDAFLTSDDSITAKLLRSPLEPEAVRYPPAGLLKVKNASRNNIRQLDIDIPLGALVSVVGVSGAGKSTLVHGIIGETLLGGKGKHTSWKSKFGTLESTLPIERLLVIDQKPIGANCRSTPASYLGIWDDIRNVFAGALEAKSRGWGPSFFSYNTGKGRCSECKGQGEITLEMSFLADAKVPCEACKGSRYSMDAETVLYAGLTISQVLALTFQEAKTFFVNHRKIHRIIKRACDLGLGYLTLGQPSHTLSGGESQRLKLVAELDAERKGHTLYILDEPTTGLHKADVARLLSGLQDLVAQGHSVIVIEHDADLIVKSHHVIEIGPDAGERGGEVVFEGLPSDLVEAATAWGKILKAQTDRAVVNCSVVGAGGR